MNFSLNQNAKSALKMLIMSFNASNNIMVKYIKKKAQWRLQKILASVFHEKPSGQKVIDSMQRI